MTSSISLPTEPITPASQPIRILLVDDQNFVLEMLRQNLSSAVELEIINVAKDGQHAIELAASLQPDLILIDIEMPNMDGIEATREIIQACPQCKVLVLSSHEDSDYIQQALIAGAKGYLSKATPISELVSAIITIQKGYACFGPQILEKLPIIDSNAIELRTTVDSSLVSYSDVPNDSHLPVARVEDFLAPISKWLSFGAIAIVGAIMLALPASAFLEYKTKVKAQATVRPTGELRLVQAAVDGQVSQILAKKGQTVKRGQVIAIIDPSRLQTQKEQLTKSIAQQRLLFAQVNAQIVNMDRQRLAEKERHYAEITAAKAELQGRLRQFSDQDIEVSTQLDEALATQKGAVAALNASKSQLSRYEVAVKKGAVSTEELEEVAQEVNQQKQDLAAAQAELKRSRALINPLATDVEVAQQRIDEVMQTGKAGSAASQREREALVGQKIEVSQQLESDSQEVKQIQKELKNTEIKATMSGTLFQLTLRNSNQTVQVGQEIAQIVPDKSLLTITAGVSPQDISNLEISQRAQMRVSSCPYTDYGILEGKVKQISKDTIQSEETQAVQGSSTQPKFYEILIAPQSKSFGKDKEQCLLQPGMELSVDIITRQETLLKFLVRKASLDNPF